MAIHGKTWGDEGKSFYSYINFQKQKKKETFPDSFCINTKTLQGQYKRINKKFQSMQIIIETKHQQTEFSNT